VTAQIRDRSAGAVDLTTVWAAVSPSKQKQMTLNMLMNRLLADIFWWFSRGGRREVNPIKSYEGCRMDVQGTRALMNSIAE